MDTTEKPTTTDTLDVLKPSHSSFTLNAFDIAMDLFIVLTAWWCKLVWYPLRRFTCDLVPTTTLPSEALACLYKDSFRSTGHETPPSVYMMSAVTWVVLVLVMSRWTLVLLTAKSIADIPASLWLVYLWVVLWLMITMWNRFVILCPEVFVFSGHVMKAVVGCATRLTFKSVNV